jgi:hypothetical protein
MFTDAGYPQKGGLTFPEVVNVESPPFLIATSKIGMTSLAAQCGEILYHSCKNTVFTAFSFSKRQWYTEIGEQRISISGFDFDGGYAEYMIARRETLAAILEELPAEERSPLCARALPSCTAAFCAVLDL